MIRILLILILASAASLRADPIEMTHNLIDGSVHSSTDIQYSFKVEVRQVPLDKVLHKRNHYYGHYDDQHEYVCSEVSILLNGKKVEIPERAYSDLCFLQSVAPPDPLEDGKWMVRIEGGSGGESYKVELVFSDTKLLERRFGYTEGTEKITAVIKF